MFHSKYIVLLGCDTYAAVAMKKLNGRGFRSREGPPPSQCLQIPAVRTVRHVVGGTILVGSIMVSLLPLEGRIKLGRRRNMMTMHGSWRDAVTPR
jgi:hypothetical protein